MDMSMVVVALLLLFVVLEEIPEEQDRYEDLLSDLPPMSYEVFQKGTYEVIDGSIYAETLQEETAVLMIDGLPPSEGLSNYLISIASLLAELFEVPDEEYPGFVEALEDSFHANPLSDEDLSELLDVDLSEPGSRFVLAESYRVEDDRLTMVYEGQEFARVAGRRRDATASTHPGGSRACC